MSLRLKKLYKPFLPNQMGSLVLANILLVVVTVVVFVPFP